MLKCHKLHVQSAAVLAIPGRFQQLETVLILFLIGNIVVTKKVSYGFGELELCAISRLVVVSDRKSHITDQHKSQRSLHDSRRSRSAALPRDNLVEIMLRLGSARWTICALLGS